MIRRIPNPQLPAYLIDDFQRDQGVLVAVDHGLPLTRQNQVDKLRHFIIIFIIICHRTYILRFGRGAFTGSGDQAGSIFNLSDYIDPVERYVSLFPLYLRGQG